MCLDGEWSCQGTPCANNNTDCGREPSPDCGCEGVDASCVAGEWVCPDVECPTCETSGASDLAGVAIEFPAQRCLWTLEEAAAGIEIPYVVAIDEPHTVMPQSQQNGCDEPGPSGLAPFGRITGMDQSYCLCDVGLCDGSAFVEQTLTPDDYEFSMSWDGVNWTGPSDFGNPKGDPFPPGNYRVEVRALGTVDGEPYEVTGSMAFTLVE